MDHASDDAAIGRRGGETQVAIVVMNRGPGLAAGLVRLPVENRDVLVYSNADEESHERVRMTAWASFDGGATWPVRRLVDAGPSAYSSLDAGRPGTPSEGWIYLQYEERGGGGKLARFRLSWLLAGEATGDGEVSDWVR